MCYVQETLKTDLPRHQQDIITPKKWRQFTSWMRRGRKFTNISKRGMLSVEGNEARPAFIVLIGVGFPEGWTRLPWDLCLAKILLTHILFLFR